MILFFNVGAIILPALFILLLYDYYYREDRYYWSVDKFNRSTHSLTHPFTMHESFRLKCPTLRPNGFGLR
jgi:hypothetical protein